MSDEAKCPACGADMAERYSEHGDLVERRCSDGAWLCRATVRALEAERAAREKAERERDEAYRKLDENHLAQRERDEARAEAANMKAAFDQGEELRALLSARVAQLEEALRQVTTPSRGMGFGGLEAAMARENALAALSTSPSDWLAEHDRALVTRAVKHAGARWVSSSSIKDSTLVEEVLHIEKVLATPLVTK